MPFDPARVGPEARAKYIGIGEDFASDDVLGQLDVSIIGADKYASELSLYGWPASQTQKMRELRDLIAVALVLRAAAKADKKTTNAALRDALRTGKIARGGARTALETARNELFEQSELELVNRIDSLLAVTASSGADAKLVAEQLGNLGALLTHEKVAPILGDSAAPLQNAVSAAGTMLDVALKSKGRPHGTPPETEHLNLLDGVAVVLARTVRKAGRAAARGLGRPDIAATFELNALYGKPPRPTGEDPAPTPPAS